MARLISIIVPVYNEEEAILLFMKELTATIGSLVDYRFEFLFINDGSSDNTLGVLQALTQADARVRVLDFSRNFGKEAALTAGLEHARGDALIPMDVDLQDPPQLIVQLIARWEEGFDMVLAQRVCRNTDGFLKRESATWFYKVHNWLAKPKIPGNVGDFRLMDRRVVDALKQLPERCRFMKGLFAWVGFRTAVVTYARPVRSAGRSHFSFWRLWNFALEGITGFSTTLLRVWSYLGAFIACIGFLYMLYIIGRTLFLGSDLPGYASLFSAVLFVGGVQLVGIGILGEYLGRIYLEVKGRPNYIIRSQYQQETADDSTR